ncbi:MAG: hypothetical protein MJ089_07235 [Ruminococcus sp.]|nr:hypothetical protein [Ruminococcus sp.]
MRRCCIIKWTYTFVCAACFCIIICLTACTGTSEKSEQKSIVTDFSADFSAEYGGDNYRGKLCTNRQGILNIYIDYPDNLKGLSVSYRSTDMQISRETLICSADEAYLPSNSFPTVVKSIMDGINNGRGEVVSQNGELCSYNLNISQGSCGFTTQNGCLKSAEIKDLDFYIEFVNTDISD